MPKPKRSSLQRLEAEINSLPIFEWRILSNCYEPEIFGVLLGKFGGHK
jgi:hypothetical protein